MAWPFTRIRTYSAAQQIRSADLNSLQDGICDLMANPAAVTLEAVADYDADGPTWGFDSYPHHGWRCRVNSGAIYFNLHSHVDAILTGYSVKLYNAHGSSSTKAIDLYKPDLLIGTPGSAPTLGYVLAANSTPIAATSWGVLTASGLTTTVAAGERLLIAVGLSAPCVAGDRVAGISININKFTPT